MGGTLPGDDDDPDTGILLEEEFSGRLPVDELEKALKHGQTVVSTPRGRGDRAARWMEEALQNSSTVVRKVQEGDTVRVGVDELPRPRRTSGGPPAERLAAAPTQKRFPSVTSPVASAEVRLEPSVTDAPVVPRDVQQRSASSAVETTAGSRDPRPGASDPGWIAVQASLWGLFVSGVLGLTTLAVFLVLS